MCYDTSARFFLRDSTKWLFPFTPIQTSDGNLLVSGQSYDVAPPQLSRGFLMKCDTRGNVLWTKTYDSAGHNAYQLVNYYKTIELADGSILLAGATNNLVTQNDDVIITRTDNTGNIIWNKIFKSRIWGFGNGSNGYFYIQDLKQDPYTGDIYFCGPHWAAGKALIKMSQVNGNILWSNLYEYSNNGTMTFDRPFGFEIRQNEIRYFSRLSAYGTYINILRINKQTGDTIQSKMVKGNDPAGYNAEFLSADQLTVTTNGHYLLSGTCYGYRLFPWNGTTPLYQGTVAEFDSSLNFVRAYTLRSPVENNGNNTKVSVFPDGSGLLTMAEVFSGFTADVFYKQFQNGQLLKTRKKRYSNGGMPYENKGIKLSDGSNLVVRFLGDSTSNARSKIEFIKLHASDTSSECLGYDNFQTTIDPVNYSPGYWPLDSVGYNVFIENPNKSLTTQPVTLELDPGCFQVAHCDSLKLITADTLLCPGQTLTLTIRKNKDCGAQVPLEYPSAVLSAVTHPNDSTYILTFNSSWTGYLRASVSGCTLIKDSVLIRVLQSPPNLNLGPDTTICPNNTVILNAHAGFATYLWQNGSTDSIFTVTQPGVYFVKTTNGCGVQFFDTVRVSAHPPIPLDLGPDKTKCNNETLQLSAPGGFLNYTWSPNYNISSTTTQTVTVNPLVDTIYTIRAEKTPGCFGFDTLRIRVFTSPPIYLGPDLNLCAGDTASLDAGPGFSSYLWNTGATTQQLLTNVTGTFAVSATSPDGCISVDTLRVLNVYPLPVVNLNPDATLCSGTSRQLNAGNGFSSYLWNTGATTSSITVSGLGEYIVMVSDNNGCKNSDTTRITTILPLPALFLAGDTTICSYGTLQLKPTRSFPQYLWNNGSTNPSMTISKPGSYWLQVKDNNNCTGKDSINVTLKDCMSGLFVPSAFTPNNDGKNDQFRPLLFGNIKKYQFTIYNRWGQIVFQSSTPGKGWNGKLGILTQDGNVFIWTCLYQVNDEPEKLEKGTVVIIR